MKSNLNKIEELPQMLKKVVWDYNIQESQLDDFFFVKIQSNSLSSIELKTILLNGNSKYKLIDVLGLDEAKKLLSDEITKGIYPNLYRDTTAKASKILNS